jgi:hypothetical protein
MDLISTGPGGDSIFIYDNLKFKVGIIELFYHPYNHPQLSTLS